MDMVLGKSFKEEKRNTLNIVECAKSKYNKMLEKGYANGAENGIIGSKSLMILPDYI